MAVATWSKGKTTVEVLGALRRETQSGTQLLGSSGAGGCQTSEATATRESVETGCTMSHPHHGLEQVIGLMS